MKNNLTLEKLQELHRKLPQDVRDAYSSVETTNVLEEIGKKHGVHLDDLGELVSETGLVMVGHTHPKNYIKNIRSRMNISGEKASAIAKDVNEQIFKPIRESLKKIHEVEERLEDPPPQSKPSQKELERESSINKSIETPTTIPKSTYPEPTPQVVIPEEKPTNLPVQGSEKNNNSLLPTTRLKNTSLSTIKELKEVQKPIEKAGSSAQKQKEEGGGDILKEKLSGHTQTLKKEIHYEEVELSDKIPPRGKGDEKNTFKRKEYTVDPYLEPID